MGKYATHSLTAYKLEFSYMERNNPLKDELKEKIKNGEKPKVSISDLISMVIKKFNSKTYLEVKDHAFVLFQPEQPINFNDGNKYSIAPYVGKANSKFLLFEGNGLAPRDYGSESATAYPYTIFIYEFPDTSYMICHRKGSSGCKTILSKVFNDVLREKGIKLETSLILPVKDSNLETYKPQKLILRYKAKPSSDIADNLLKNKRFKEIVVRELSINLKVPNNSVISNALGRRISKDLPKDDAFLEIKNALGNDEYNDADILFKVGKAYRTVKWDNFEELFEGKDITEDLANMGGDSDTNISTCADDYIKEIRSAEK